MIVRFESWGAWVKLETTGALVALDRAGVGALGLAGGRAWTDAPPPARPLEVHLAVTSRCAAGCEGCYLDARPDGEDPPRRAIAAALDAIARAGAFTVAFGGGEPTLRADLAELAGEARARGLTPVITTSGLGLDARDVEALARFAQVNVSYDGPADAYASVRGFDGARHAEAAIERLARAGLKVGVNVVLTRSTWGRTAETVRRARALGATEAQLLRYKPQGRARSASYLARRLSPSQARELGPLLRALSAEHEGHMAIRIDCALVAFLSADAELAAAPDRLARWGVFGCEAGAALAAVRVDGKVAGCSFAGASELDAADMAEGFATDPTLASLRAHAEAPEEPCASCTLRPICRGGCRVVADHVVGRRGAPDPECPRVRDRRLG